MYNVGQSSFQTSVIVIFKHEKRGLEIKLKIFEARHAINIKLKNLAARDRNYYHFIHVT